MVWPYVVSTSAGEKVIFSGRFGEPQSIAEQMRGPLIIITVGGLKVGGLQKIRYWMRANEKLFYNISKVDSIFFPFIDSQFSNSQIPTIAT